MLLVGLAMVGEVGRCGEVARVSERELVSKGYKWLEVRISRFLWALLSQ